MATDAEKNLYLEIWKKTVDTQMHFNEMSVKSRQLGLSFVAAALGVGLVLLSKEEDFSISVDVFNWFSFNLHVAVLVILAAIFALIAVKRLDLGVYHKMLRGAVSFGEDFEENYMKEIFDLDKGMTQAISHFSRHEDAKVNRKNGSKKYAYAGTSSKSAYDKISGFYSLTTKVLWAVAIVLLIVTNLNAIK